MIAPFEQFLNLLNSEISETQIEQLQKYVSLLQQYNQKLNLISRKDIPNIWENHIYPSLLVNNFVDLPLGVAVADLGSGGGLPGIPLKIIRPDLNLVLIDSSLKKTAFLRQVIHILGIPSTAVMQVRINPREEVDLLNHQFEVILARAVAGFQDLWNLTKPLLKQDGFLVAWKGTSDLYELRNSSLEMGLDFKVMQIPETFWPHSKKLRQLCFVKIWSIYSQSQ
jgi:16S rRNA (guanine527-N7)-methyltransferase